MPWISKDKYLSQSEMENNATIIIQYYRSLGINDNSIAGMLGNMQAESTLSPVLTERGGGGGYGLVQWTPKSDLTNACDSYNLHPYTSGDVQIEVIRREVLNTPPITQWYSSRAFVSRYYKSGATSDMIGITGEEFLNNSRNFTADKLAICFMACYERPSYDPDVNHSASRQQYALNWLEFMGGVPPTPTPTSSKKKNKFPIWCLPRFLRGGF